MSWAAIRRVYEVDDAKCSSPSQLAALLAIASYCGPDMKGCYAGQATLAKKAHMSVKSFQRQRDELVDLGLIVPGDASLVAHIRADKRPDVWDLGCTNPEQARRQIDVSQMVAAIEAQESAWVPEPVPRHDNLSANGATECRTNLKSKEEPKNLSASDAASASSLSVDASHRRVPPPAGQATESSRTRPAKPKRKRVTLPQYLEAYLVERGPSDVDTIYCEFVARSEPLLEWAIDVVRKEMGYADDARPHDDGFGDEFARKSVVAACMRARQPDGGGFGELSQKVLAGFDWEPWRRKKPPVNPDDQHVPVAPQKLPRWRPDQEGLRAEEMRRAEGAVWYLDTPGLLALEKAVAELDGAAYEFGRRGVAERHSDVVGEQARRLSLVYALSIRPLSSWPQQILPWEIRADDSLVA